MYEYVLDMFSRLSSTPARRKTLGVPCGASVLSVRMAAIGLAVTSVNFEAVEPFRHDPMRHDGLVIISTPNVVSFRSAATS